MLANFLNMSYTDTSNMLRRNGIFWTAGFLLRRGNIMAGLKIHVMKTVSEGTKEIIIRRARMDGLRELFQTHAALALCNGNVCDLIYASDLAQKTSEVEVFEISGNCPQHLTCLAILGSAAAVDEAVERIRSELGG